MSLINVLGAGATLQVNLSGWQTLGNITAINGPEIETDDVNITNLSSPNLFKVWMAGWADAGVAEMEANFDPGTFATLYAQIRVSNSWQIVFSNGSKWTFTGYLKNIKTENPLEEQVTMPFSIKITGQPTFTQ
jgi:hypothetical protein